jgi:hypothetical protein
VEAGVLGIGSRGRLDGRRQTAEAAERATLDEASA